MYYVCCCWQKRGFITKWVQTLKEHSLLFKKQMDKLNTFKGSANYFGNSASFGLKLLKCFTFSCFVIQKINTLLLLLCYWSSCTDLSFAVRCGGTGGQMRSLSACPFHISVSFFLLFLFCMYSFVKQNQDALSRRSSINSIQSAWVITLCYNILLLSARLPPLSLFICPFSICALLSHSLVFLFSPQDLNKTKLQSVIASLPVKYNLWFLLKK